MKKRMFCVVALLLLVPFLLGFTGIQRDMTMSFDGDITYHSKSGGMYGETVVDIKGDGKGDVQSSMRYTPDEHLNTTSIVVEAGEEMTAVVGTKDTRGNVYVHGVKVEDGGLGYLDMDVAISDGMFPEVNFVAHAEVTGVYRRNIDILYPWIVDEVLYHTHIFEELEVDGWFVGGDYIRFQPNGAEDLPENALD